MKKGLLLLGISILFYACKPTQVLVDRPDELVSQKRFETELSSLNIPIKISVPDMQKGLNKELESFVLEDTDVVLGVNYSFKGRKYGTIHLSLDQNKLVYTIPTLIDVKMNAYGFETSTQIKSVMKFSSSLDINDDWSVKSSTKLLSYKILNDPSLKSVIEHFIAGSKGFIEKKIDKEVVAFFPTKEELTKTWVEIQEPYLLSEDYSAWVVARPQAVRMSSLKGIDNNIVTNIGIDTYLDIKVGEKPYVNKNPKLPNLDKGTQGGGMFKIAIGTQIDFNKATEVLKNNFVGYEFEYKKKKKIVIRDIEVYANGDNIVIGMSFDGDMEGKIYMTGIPKYDKDEEKIYIDDFKFDAKTKNALLNIAEVMVKGPFKKKI